MCSGRFDGPALGLAFCAGALGGGTDDTGGRHGDTPELQGTIPSDTSGRKKRGLKAAYMQVRELAPRDAVTIDRPLRHSDRGTTKG